jgi:hypothetical protein
VAVVLAALVLGGALGMTQSTPDTEVSQ